MELPAICLTRRHTFILADRPGATNQHRRQPPGRSKPPSRTQLVNKKLLLRKKALQHRDFIRGCIQGLQDALSITLKSCSGCINRGNTREAFVLALAESGWGIGSTILANSLSAGCRKSRVIQSRGPVERQTMDAKFASPATRRSTMSRAKNELII